MARSVALFPGTRLAEAHGRAQKGQDEWVRRFGAGRKLRLKKRGDEEAVVRQLHGPRFAQDPARADAQTGGLELLLILLIHAVVAVVLFGVVFAPANRVKKSPRQNLQSLVAGAFGAAITTVRQGAGKRRDDAVRGAGIVFRRVRVGNSQDISRIL
jgi:hypothetical protein